MKCPYCGNSDDRVLDTRVQKDGAIRRRRECLECKARFSTMETLMLHFPMIVKKDGRREPFSKDKIFRGLQARQPETPDQLESTGERRRAHRLLGHQPRRKRNLFALDRQKSYGRDETTG